MAILSISPEIPLFPNPLLPKTSVIILHFLYTEVFRSTGFGNNRFSGITDILAIPKLKFCIKRAQSNGFPGITDKMAIPN